ncbi:MAG: ABC transporter substrate-binding protein [Planctomycetota bacterium]|nr:ABC transporter substrate-binding protein [Planctomycetota bacterium]
MKLKIVLIGVAAFALLAYAHYRFNSGPISRGSLEPENPPSTAAGAGQAEAPKEREVFRVGFLPVTCHLTCPVTSWVTQHSSAGTKFQAERFSDFPTMKEALIARKIDATFMIVPLAMKLAADGVPVKIVYLGHRDGSALTVGIDSPFKEFKDLAGKRVAIPSRFSNQHLLMQRMLKQNGMARDAIELVEMAPPDMPGALAAKAIDGYIVGEPHGARAEMAGYGRVLFFMKDLWPDFISCGLVVRQELINDRPELVQELVDGIAASGLWLEDDIDDGAQHRKQASEVVGKVFYNQDPKLLEWVLTRPTDRVRYDNLLPTRKNFDEIMDLAVEMNVITKRMAFEEYCDAQFAPDLGALPKIENFPPPDVAAKSDK